MVGILQAGDDPVWQTQLADPSLLRASATEVRSVCLCVSSRGIPSLDTKIHTCQAAVSGRNMRVSQG
jgi:hypothetical protein